jgi:hypothetical protein
MSVDTIYKRQFLSIQQAALCELIGVNLADVRQLQDELTVKAEKFTKGIIPENEAADFARETGDNALEYTIHAGEELGRLQEEQKKPVQHSPGVEEFLSGLSEEQKNLIRNENESMSEITALENLITELKRLHEMAWYFTAHIQDYAATPEYRERRQNILLTGEPAPDTQALERKAAGVPKDPTKATLIWLRKKQWIKSELVEEKQPVPINGGLWTPNNVYENRITKTAAFIYRGLVDAAENREIPLEKDAIADFMINSLKQKDGGNITHDLLTKADKRRKNKTK